jgi:hypothetical protein
MFEIFYAFLSWMLIEQSNESAAPGEANIGLVIVHGG